MAFDIESAAEIERADISVGRVDEVLALDAYGVYALASGPPPVGDGRAAAQIFLDTARDFAEDLRRVVDVHAADPSARKQVHAIFQGVFDQASETIRGAYAGATPDTSGTLLVVGTEAAAVAHVGKTRAYILRGGDVVRLTRDVRDDAAEAADAGDRTRLAPAGSGPGGAQAMGQRHTLHVDAIVFRLMADTALMLVSEGIAETLRGHELLGTLGAIPSIHGLAGAVTKAAAQRQAVADSSAIVVAVAAAGRPLNLAPPRPEQEARADPAGRGGGAAPGPAAPAPPVPPVPPDLAARDLEILAKADLFTGLSRELLARLHAAMDVVTLEGGDLLYARGEAAGRLYLVTHGGLEAVRDGTVLAQLPVAQLSGEATLYATAASSVWVRATAPTRVLEVRLDRLESLADTDPPLAAPLFRSLARRSAIRSQRARPKRG